MKIVIDIPKEIYESVKTDMWCGSPTVGQAILNGIPLPKGHGKIGDLDAVMSDISTTINGMTNAGIMVNGEFLWGKLNDAIYNAPTIIEAESEEEE